MLTPISHFKDELNNAETVAGKIAVVLFHAFVWLMVLALLILLIFPSIMPDCVFGGFDEYTKVLLWGFMRIFLIFFLVFLLYVERFGTKNVGNVEALTFLTVLSWFLFYKVTKKRLDALDLETATPKISEDCWKMMRTGDAVWCFWPVVVLVFLWFERAQTTRSGNGPEREPLVTG